MKHILIASAFATAFAMTAPAVASEGGSCHFHGSKPAEEKTVVGCAVQRKDGLVANGKIDAAWKSIKHDKVEQVDGKNGKEWKVTFTDPAAKDKAKETLYVFFTLPGNFVAANFTGK
jgi:hypothetical protein